jgi:hypothetical protein
MPSKVCKEKLSEKIRINMREYRKGRWKSPQQAIAVSYAQVLKKSPSCKKALRAKKSSQKTKKSSQKTKKSARKTKKSARKTKKSSQKSKKSTN